MIVDPLKGHEIEMLSLMDPAVFGDSLEDEGS